MPTVRQPKTENLKPNASSAELKVLVNTFDFWEPDWSKLPYNFTKLPTNELTKYEQGLLTAVKLAYLNSKHGRRQVKKRFVKAGSTVVIAIAIVAFVQLTITSPAVNVVKSVAAATMSAILR